MRTPWSVRVSYSIVTFACEACLVSYFLRYRETAIVAHFEIVFICCASFIVIDVSKTTSLELLARFELIDLFVGIRDETMIGNLVEFRDEVIVIFQNFCL